ncbi:periphilin-1 [Coregonus clupeaformis]|uniref:periphilin-1 n=1 Tax=Coregonus clupeaformis TaxID=59861 RepID=UPI001E1C387F|nr:periphilin-1 [Coregonus clupeaformis]
MAYRRDRSRIREAYDELISERAGTYQRVVNVVERRTAVTRPEQEYDREFEYETKRYSGIQSYQDDDQRGYPSDNIHTGSDRGYHGDMVGSIRGRNSPPPRQEDYRDPYYRGSRDDCQMGRQGEIRNSSRAGSHPSSRVQGLAPLSRTVSPAYPDRVDPNLRHALMYLGQGENPEGFRRRVPGPYPAGPAGDSYTTVRDRSPIRRDTPPIPGPILMRSGSNTSRRSYSPDRDQKGFSYHQKGYIEEPPSQSREPGKPRLLGHSKSASLDGSPHSAVSIREERDPTPALLPEPEDTVPAKDETDQTQEDNFKTRRSQAIAAKALEIEKLYKRDCETFGTVVKMLVVKEPSLEKLLQNPLKDNLIEIRERCLDDLRHFIIELDQVIKPKPSM